MAISPLSLYQVQVQESTGTLNTYAVENATSPSNALQMLLNNNLIPNDVSLITIGTFSANLVTS